MFHEGKHPGLFCGHGTVPGTLYVLNKYLLRE